MPTSVEIAEKQERKRNCLILGGIVLWAAFAMASGTQAEKSANKALTETDPDKIETLKNISNAWETAATISSLGFGELVYDKEESAYHFQPRKPTSELSQ